MNWYIIIIYKSRKKFRTSMDKASITKLVALKSDRISFSNGEGSSDVWPHFSRVILDGLFCHHVLCNDCTAVLKWKSKDGTSGLKAHLTSCKSGSSDRARKLTDCHGVSVLPTFKRLSTADKQDVTKAVVNFCARDIRPFCVIEGRYLKKVM